MPTYFTPKTLAFLRALARNNDREWFKARKGDFDRHVKAPLLALLEHLASDLHTIAPELACSPKESTFRQYRDTRFSENKSPLKTNVALVFPPRGLPRHAGAGLYMSLDARHVFIGGGMWHPERASLQAVREHIAGNSRPAAGDRGIAVVPQAIRKTERRLADARAPRLPRGSPRGRVPEAQGSGRDADLPR